MTAVTFPNGDSYSDDGTTANDMRNGGFRTNLLPMIGDTITVANSAVSAAAAAVPAATSATTAATTATTQAAIAVAAANTAVGTSLIKQPNEIAGIDPALDFVFSSSLALPSGVVQSSSAKYVFDRAGLLTSVASLTPPIDFDPVTSVTRGLLVEEARTNLVLQSRDFSNAAWTKSGVTVASTSVATPFGTTAQKLVESSLNEQHYVSQTLSGAATIGAKYVSYIIAKAAERIKVALTAFGEGYSVFNLSTKTVESAGGNTAGLIDLGNGWCLCYAVITRTSSNGGYFWSVWGSTASTYLGDGTSGIYVCHAQVDTGSFPLSIIPTLGSSVLRQGDTDAFALSSVPGWNASEGTIYVEARTALGSGTQTYAQYDDGTANNRLCVYRDSSNVLRAIVVVSGSTVVNLNLGTVANDTAFKVAFAWKANSFAASVNGGAAVTSSSGAIPSGLTTHRIGHDSSGNHANGPIRRDVGFPRAVSSATTTLLTA